MTFFILIGGKPLTNDEFTKLYMFFFFNAFSIQATRKRTCKLEKARGDAF